LEGAQAICRDITERVITETKLNNYYNDLKTNYELKQSILGAKTIEALAGIVLTKLINNSKITQFITLNLIQEKQFHVYYIDVFSKQIRESVADYTPELKKALLWLVSNNYQSFQNLNDVNRLYLLQQPKFAKNALVHEFKDNTEVIGFIGLYTDFEFDYEKHDTHFISDIANYIKTYIVEIEKNKIIEKKNKEIQDYSKQLESANESLATRNRFQEMVIQSGSFDDLNDTILKTIIKDSAHAKTYVFNYFNHKTNELNSYYINKNNTFTFRNKLKLNPEQVELHASLNNTLLFHETESEFQALQNLTLLQQPVSNINSAIIAVIRPKQINNGFIGVYSHKQNIYDIHDLHFTMEIANVMQIALTQFENKQLIDQKNSEIEAQNKNLAVLNEAQNTLINNITVEDVFNDLLELLFNKLANIDRASVLKFDFDKKIALLHHISVRHPFVRKKDLSFDRLFILGSFIRSGIYDVSDFDLKPELVEDEKKWYYSGIRSAYAIPVFINNKIYASINLFSNVPGNFNELKNTINQIVSSAQLIIGQLINQGIISEKNKNISANINYAKRIQDAFLPNEDNLKKVFGKSFALLLQRDALGGDFYWVREHEQFSMIAVGDCTGHGVSGALLSILSTTYLNTIIEKYQNYDPGIILDFLSSSIYNAFHQKNTDTDVNDGLDISFCTLDRKNKKLLFSGAMQTIYIIRNGVLIEQKGNRKPIGLENKNLKGNYDTITIEVSSGDKIYMTSDGAIDQFSSTTEKRLGNKRFKEILHSLESFPLKERKRQLLKELNLWRGNAHQTDDICVVSFEVD
jgi:serine phosphatase RsbU (regulator of sigma subunit)